MIVMVLAYGLSPRQDMYIWVLSDAKGNESVNIKGAKDISGQFV
jgi:hypothetical protein